MAKDTTQNPLYKFVNGNGDSGHQDQVNREAGHGYEVVSMVFNPDATPDGLRLMVLMRKKRR